MESVYVNVVNKMLRCAREGSGLSIKENSVSLNKLLHHPDSYFEDIIKEKNIEVKVFTWVDGENTYETLDKFLRIGAKIFILPEYDQEHYTIIDNPKQVWVEGRHKKKGKYAYNCMYTPQPYDKIWQAILKHFSQLEAIPYEIKLSV